MMCSRVNSQWIIVPMALAAWATAAIGCGSNEPKDQTPGVIGSGATGGSTTSSAAGTAATSGAGSTSAGGSSSAAGAGAVSKPAGAAGAAGVGAAGSGAAGTGTVIPVAGSAGTAPSNTGGTGGGASGDVTYHKDIRAVIEANCLTCHVAGGVGPFPLDSWLAVNSTKGLITSAVMSGVMPPFPASTSCRDIADARSLSQPTKDLFAAWAKANYPEGNAADYKAPLAITQPVEDIGPAQITLAPALGYTPPNNADDYHCFTLDKTFDEDTYLTAIDIVPDQINEVHHVQVHRISAATKPVDSGAGYPCTTTGENMFSWRPGGTRLTFEKTDAAYIEAGSAIMLQVHYNTMFLGGKAPVLDKSSLKLWTLPAGNIPDRIIYRQGILQPLISIPANAANVHVTASSSLSTLSAVGGTAGPVGNGFGGRFVPGEIIGMTPHAHQIAHKMDATIQHADGTSECLIDVPVWDYHWQLDYMYTKPVQYTAGDTITANCDYDNSAGHQPVINGETQTPRTVTFGEGSLDEMCLHYVWLRFGRADFLAAKGTAF
ncbi:MAG: hypothetical protein RL701_6292 [Pseudomonadota bacterium]|jgi:hypothetical protein